MGLSRWIRPAAGAAVLSVSVGMWVTACGGSSDTSGLTGDDGGGDAIAIPVPFDAGGDAGDDGGGDATVDAGSDAGADADATVDAGDAGDSGDAADAGNADADGDAAGDDGGDAAADADADAAPQYCVGSAGTVTVNVTCPPSSTTACTPTDGGSDAGDAGDGGACGDNGGASYSSCTSTGCTATGNGIDYSIACYDGSDCTVGLGGIDFCAACGANATCVFTDTGSAGSQAYYCGPGSDCTIHMNGSSGSRIVDCSQAKKCTVDGFVSGETQVDCPADCSVKVTGGFSTACCPNPPMQCQDGSYRCVEPGDAGDAGGDGGGDGGC